jgi:hypothetical protein
MELRVENVLKQSRLWRTDQATGFASPRDFVADLRTPANFMTDRLDSRVLHAQRTTLILHWPVTVDRPAKGGELWVKPRATAPPTRSTTWRNADTSFLRPEG